MQRLPGSIGYVEYAYALQNKMAYALLQNKDGNFVAPDDKTFRAAAANAQWDKAPGFYLLLTDQPGKESWPITGATFILMHKKQDKPENAAIALKFFDWAYEAGDKLALDLDYVPMPDSVVKLVKAEWKRSRMRLASRLILSVPRNHSRGSSARGCGLSRHFSRIAMPPNEIAARSARSTGPARNLPIIYGPSPPQRLVWMDALFQKPDAVFRVFRFLDTRGDPDFAARAQPDRAVEIRL